MNKKRNRHMASRLLAICVSLVLAISGIISVSALATYSGDVYISSGSSDVESMPEAPVSEEPVLDEPSDEDAEEEPVTGEDEVDDDEFVDEEVELKPAIFSAGLNEVTVTNVAQLEAAIADFDVDVIVVSGTIHLTRRTVPGSSWGMLFNTTAQRLIPDGRVVIVTGDTITSKWRRF
ncbi:MAG: hypothetical protein FWE29_03950 [Defluviitaleaceae bacterium]|nr:hypothetical protein [Defluviitaleaceae bacterium]